MLSFELHIGDGAPNVVLVSIDQEIIHAKSTTKVRRRHQ